MSQFDRLKSLTARAKTIACNAASPEHVDGALAILEAAMEILEALSRGLPTGSAPVAACPPASSQTASAPSEAQPVNSGTGKTEAERPMKPETTYADAALAGRSKKKKKSGWTTVTAEKGSDPQPVQLAEGQWDVPVITAADVTERGLKRGAIYATQQEAREVLGLAAQWADFGQDLAIAVVTSKPATTDSARQLVRLKSGQYKQVHCTLRGAKPTTPERRTGVDCPRNTVVLLFTADLRLVHPDTAVALRSADAGVTSLHKLCGSRAKQAGITIEGRHRFHAVRYSDRHTLCVRVPLEEAEPLLRSSGPGGLFWSQLSFHEGGERHPSFGCRRARSSTLPSNSALHRWP